MKRRTIAIAIFALIAVLLMVAPVFAYIYRAPYTVVSGNTTDFEMLGVSTDNGVNNLWMAANGFMNSTANDTRIETLGGLEKPHMVTDNDTFTAIPVPANSQTNLYFTTGNSEQDFDIIPGYGGSVNVTDALNLELGDNFTIEQSGWVDTSFPSDLIFIDGFFIDGWTDVGAGVGVDIADSRLEYDVAGGDHRSSFDIGTANISDTEWKLDFIWYPDALPADAFIALGFFETLGNITGYGDDAIYFLADNSVVRVRSVDEGGATTSATFAIALDTTYYGTLERIASDNVSLSIFTDAARTTHQTGSPKSIACAATTVGLRYIQASNVNGATGTSKGWFDDVGMPYYYEKILIQKDGAFFTYISDTEEITSLGGGVPVTATSIASGEHTVTTTEIAALDFERANSDWVSVPDHANFDFTDGAGNDEPFTIIVRVNLEDATSSAFISKYTAAGNNFAWQFGTSVELLQLICIENDASGHINRKTGAVTGYEGAWTHFAGTYDGSETSAGINLYVESIDADTVTSENLPYTGMSPTANVVDLGSTGGGTANFLDGRMSELKIYTAELTPAEIVADYNGGHRTTNLEAWWRLDEGAGNPTDSSGNGHNATANLADWVLILRIYIDDILRDLADGASIPNTSANWTFLQNNVMPYADNITITVGGALELWFQPNDIISGTTLPDRQGGDNPGTFIWGSNPDEVSVIMGGLVSEAQPSPGLVIDDPTPDIMPGVEVTDWYIEPDVTGALLTNPFRPFVIIMSDTTTLTELQAWRLLGTALLLMVVVGTASAVRGHQGITAIAAGAGILGLVVLTIYPMWALVVGSVMLIGGLIAERSPSL